MNLFDLTGKKAIVTGANHGLGLSMAEGLCESGAEVVILGRSDEGEKTLTAKGHKAHSLICDLEVPIQRAEAFGRAIEIFEGSLDILVNNAGIQIRHSPEEFPIEEFDRVMEINMRAVFHLCQLAGRIMLEQKSGKIINIASLISFFGGKNIPAYAASKGAVAQLTKSMSNAWAKSGVCVNAIAPGYMATTMNTALMQDEVRSAEILTRIPAGRWGNPEDMKGICIFLSSSASDYLTGTVIPVDGGYMGY